MKSTQTDELLPPACESVSTSEEVGTAIGHSLKGQLQTAVGQPDSKIGRTARLDCYYGLSDGQPVTDALITIGLATYTDAQSAAHRVEATVGEERDAGARVTQVKVGADQGTLLRGSTTTLVVAHGSTTVVVIAAADAVSASQAKAALTTLASRALQAH